MLRRNVLFVWLLMVSSLAFGAKHPMLLKVGFPEGLPGYVMRANHTLEIEVPFKKRVVQCIEKTLNAKFIWESYPTNRVMEMLLQGNLDLAFPMGFTAERARKMIQSDYTWENADYLLSMRPVDVADKTLRISARLGSPQHTDYVAEGYTRVVGTYTYEELIKTLSMGLSDMVIVPKSVYEDQASLWPKELVVTVGRQRNTGFYLNAADPRQLSGRLNRAIERCRAAAS